MKNKSFFSNITQNYYIFMQKHSTIVLLLIALITIFFSYKITEIKISANYEMLMANVEPSPFILTPENNTIKDKIYVEDTISSSDVDYGEYTDGFVFMVSAPTEILFSADTLNRISNAMMEIEKEDVIGQCLSPFDFVTIQKKGTRLAPIPMNPNKGTSPWTEEEAQIFKSRLMNDDIAKNYLYNEDGTALLIYYRMKANISNETLFKLKATLDPIREVAKVSVSGGASINERVMYYLKKDLINLLSLCLLVILIIYYLSFRAKRAVLIPFSMSLIGIIWTLGMMTCLGYSISLVTVLTPCLVLILGSSYSIHMISAYYDSYKKKIKQEISGGLIIGTILFACTTTVAGFLSLLISRNAVFKEFGISISIGVIFCALLALSYLPAIFSKISDPKKIQLQLVSRGKLTILIHRTGFFVIKFWKLLLGILALLIILFSFVYNKVGFESNYMSYFPKTDPFVQENLDFARTMGGTDPYYLTINAPNGEKNFFLKPENLQKVQNYESAIMENCPDIVQILSFPKYVSFLNKIYSNNDKIPEQAGLINMLNKMLTLIKNQIDSNALDVLINEDASQITLSMRNYDSIDKDLQTTKSARRIENTLDEYRYLLPENTSSRIWCLASDTLRANDMILLDQKKATYLSFILVFIICAIAFFSFKFGICALIPIFVGIIVNYIFMWVASIPFDLVTVGFSSVTIGVGIDDAIHFILNFKRQKLLRPNSSIEKTIINTINATGRAITLTTLSIVFGMLMLTMASYSPIRYFGIMLSLSLMSAMISTLIFLPAVIIAIEKFKSKFLIKNNK
ncbi:MAG: RND transporter [Spirochaetia bacterium]|nr:RND transporter [Spirochaetia bacterium]